MVRTWFEVGADRRDGVRRTDNTEVEQLPAICVRDSGLIRLLEACKDRLST